MYARRAVRPKARTSQHKQFPAPVGGWVANQNLAMPNVSLDGRRTPQGAAILENYFPTATSAILRRGSELYATLGDASLPTTALFKYQVGIQNELFAATETAIYDVTTVLSASNWSLVTEDGDSISTDDDDTFGQDSTEGLDVWQGATGGDWSVVQFATTGGIYLVGVNGESEGFIYDGASFYPNVPSGVWKLDYDAETSPFTEGETLTGGTSAATATIVKVTDDGTTGTLWLKGITGTFQDNETITDGAGGSAAANGVVSNLVAGVAFPSGVALDTADLIYVWAYKNRLFFIQKDSLDVWYLDVDSIGGELVHLPMGGIFQHGGRLLFGASWSLDSGGQGGLSEQCIFVTTEGEVAVFQGVNPGDAASWGKVGVYRIGKPLGAKAWIRAGGDLVIATTIGFVPLSQAIQRDYAALSPSAVSFPIETAWNEAARTRTGEWSSLVWPEGQMVIVAPPVSDAYDPEVFVANARTGAWAKFTGWEVTCLEVFQGRLFFGSTDGRVIEANVGGLDLGEPYSGRYLPLFEDFGSSASLKIAKQARTTFRASISINDRLSCQIDYSPNLPPDPAAQAVPTGNEWGNAIWGESVWSGQANAVITQQWQSLSGAGYVLSPASQITSGSVVPLDAELIRTDMMFEIADVMT